jgi:hypothetical protein
MIVFFFTEILSTPVKLFESEFLHFSITPTFPSTSLTLVK